MAELFQTTPQNVTLHLRGIFSEGELVEAATCKDYLQVRFEGGREVSRKLHHYHLDAILAVGFRVRSHRGTQFRQWAIGRLNEYLVKGFTMDDERLKNPPGKGQKDYFDEQLERIRDIRSSERRFYQKVLDIYATSVDYTPDTELGMALVAAAESIAIRVRIIPKYGIICTLRVRGPVRGRDAATRRRLSAARVRPTRSRVGSRSGCS